MDEIVHEFQGLPVQCFPSTRAFQMSEKLIACRLLFLAVNDADFWSLLRVHLDANPAGRIRSCINQKAARTLGDLGELGSANMAHRQEQQVSDWSRGSFFGFRHPDQDRRDNGWKAADRYHD